MSKLHEILAAEKTVVDASKKLFNDTNNKFGKTEAFFTGHGRTLKMIADTPENKAIEVAARTEKVLATNVVDTLSYFLAHWAKSENLLASKNLTNTKALADIEFRNEVIAVGVPVDELLGLESRLLELRGLFVNAPTLDASKRWTRDEAYGVNTWVAPEENSSKTEKQAKAVVLYEATDKHPAQVKEVVTDVVVGTFTDTKRSGALTAVQKSELLGAVDELLAEVKKARQRANSVEVVSSDVGSIIARQLLAAVTGA